MSCILRSVQPPTCISTFLSFHLHYPYQPIRTLVLQTVISRSISDRVQGILFLTALHPLFSRFFCSSYLDHIINTLRNTHSNGKCPKTLNPQISKYHHFVSYYKPTFIIYIFKLSAPGIFAVVVNLSKRGSHVNKKYLWHYFYFTVLRT